MLKDCAGSADGKWLVIWESASQGHALFVYTADGHLFKTWNGPTLARTMSTLPLELASRLSNGVEMEHILQLEITVRG